MNFNLIAPPPPQKNLSLSTKEKKKRNALNYIFKIQI